MYKKGDRVHSERYGYGTVTEDFKTFGGHGYAGGVLFDKLQGKNGTLFMLDTELRHVEEQEGGKIG